MTEPTATGQVASPDVGLLLVRLPRQPLDRWALLDPYVELVWVETVGVAAVAVARRVALLIGGPSPVHTVTVGALAGPLHLRPGKVLLALRRLHHHGLVVFREHTGIVATSGYAPDLAASQRVELSPHAARLHHTVSRNPGPVVDTAPTLQR